MGKNENEGVSGTRTRVDTEGHGGRGMVEEVFPKREMEKWEMDFGPFPCICQAETCETRVLDASFRAVAGLCLETGGILEVWPNRGAEGKDGQEKEDI